MVIDDIVLPMPGGADTSLNEVGNVVHLAEGEVKEPAQAKIDDLSVPKGQTIIEGLSVPKGSPAPEGKTITEGSFVPKGSSTLEVQSVPNAPA